MLWNNVVKGIGAAFTAFVLLVAVTPIVNVMSRQMTVQEDLRKSDAIVVLGAGMNENMLSTESLQRLLRGIILYKKNFAPILILSGPPQGSGSSEASVRAGLAAELGVPRSAIIPVSDVNTTRDEAIRVSELLSGAGRRQIVLVTEPLHMRRAKLVFEAMGLTVSPGPSDNFPATANSPTERLELLKTLTVQLAGLVYYHVFGFI